MNEPTVLSIVFGTGTLVGVIATFAGNYFLKKLELKDREKERKFKVEEKMIEKSIEAHMEAFDQIVRIFSIVNQYYAGEGTLQIPDEKRGELSELLEKFNEWRRSSGFFLDKRIREQIGLVIDFGNRALGVGLKPGGGKMDIWVNLWKTMKGLIEVLETILKQYNPLYDLNIKLPEIENP